VCLGLVRLLHFLSHSPLGSVALLDFQPRQFVMVSGELKLTDLDDASVTEPACQTDQDCVLQFPLRNFSQPCSAQGESTLLLFPRLRYFFTYLLPHQAPPALRHLVDHIMNSTGEMKGGVNDTLEAFEDMLHLYKSGHAPGQRASIINQRLCSHERQEHLWKYAIQMLALVQPPRLSVQSVHSAKEVAFISGRLLASFRSGFSHLVSDVNSEVYLKKMKDSTGTTV
ncbi:unnamed protein product, partial [Coregonus sp. 'balchen']